MSLELKVLLVLVVAVAIFAVADDPRCLRWMRRKVQKRRGLVIEGAPDVLCRRDTDFRNFELKGRS